MFLPEELLQAVAAVEVLEEVEATPGVDDEGRAHDEPGMQIPTKGSAAISPIRPIGAAARIAGAVGPGIEGPAMEVSGLGYAHDG